MSSIVSHFEGGQNCKYGQCQCKNKAGMRCGLCAQAGSRFCHLHQGCTNMAVPMDYTPDIPGKVWVQIPAAAVKGVTGAIFPETAGKLTRQMLNVTSAPARVLSPAPVNSSDMLKMRTQQLIAAYSGSLTPDQINAILADSVKSVEGSKGSGVAAAVTAPLTAVASAAAAAIGAPATAVAAATGLLAEAFGTLGVDTAATGDPRAAAAKAKKEAAKKEAEAAKAAAKAAAAAARAAKVDDEKYKKFYTGRAPSPPRERPVRVSKPVDRYKPVSNPFDIKLAEEAEMRKRASEGGSGLFGLGTGIL